MGEGEMGGERWGSNSQELHFTPRIYVSLTGSVNDIRRD